ncbi:MAG TPA: cellulase family glycosylhydrolase, partial [Marinagarivorans sp.]
MSSSVASSSQALVSSSSASSETESDCGIARDDVPYCLGGTFSDPDGDGWGWENEASCVVPDGPADLNPGTCVLEMQEPGNGASSGRIMYNGEAIYLNGFNIAWFEFARDFGNGVDENQLRAVLQDVTDAGGNSLRWWFHVDGSMTPEWGAVNGQRLVTGPGGSAIADLQQALDIASEYGVYIIPALWSFDMLRDNDFRQPPTQDNYRLLSDDAVLQSYLDNALVPMVEQLNGHSQLLAWELFNEPENMTETWFRNEDAYYGGPVPTLEMLQRVQAKMAAAIHRAANDIGQTALVTTGSKSMGKYNSDVA